MSAKALKYAEQTLGVHEVWENVQTYLQDLDGALAELDNAQDRKRELDELYADQEVELITQMRGVHPSMSDTRFNSEMKMWVREDSGMRNTRAELNKVRSTIQGLEYDVDLIRLRIKANSARMEELGGYLHYLAAVKNRAEQTNKTTETSSA